jgi:hypothetical protein
MPYKLCKEKKDSAASGGQRSSKWVKYNKAMQNKSIDLDMVHVVK